MPSNNHRSPLYDPGREALARFRESIDREDFEEDTGVHVHLGPVAPQTAADGAVTKLKAAALALGTGLGTGIVMAVLQHCGGK